MRVQRFIPLSALVALLIACGGDGDSPGSIATPDATIHVPPSPGASVEPPSSQPPPPPAGAGRIIAADNIKSLQVMAQAQVQGVQRLIWSSKGELYIVTRAEVLRLVSGGDDADVVFATGAGGEIISISTTGVVAVADEARESLSLFDVQGNRTHVLRPGKFTTADFSPDGTQIAVSMSDRIAVSLFDVQAGAPLKELTGFQTAAPVYGAHFTPDGKSMAWLSRAKLQLQDVASGTLRPAIEHQEFVSAFDVSRDGATIATAAGEQLTLFEAATGALRVGIPQSAGTTGVSFSPDGRMFATVTATSLQFWDVATSKALDVVTGRRSQVAFAPDGRAIATVDPEGVAILEPSDD